MKPEKLLASHVKPEWPYSLHFTARNMRGCATIRRSRRWCPLLKDRKWPRPCFHINPSLAPRRSSGFISSSHTILGFEHAVPSCSIRIHGGEERARAIKRDAGCDCRGGVPCQAQYGPCPGSWARLPLQNEAPRGPWEARVGWNDRRNWNLRRLLSTRGLNQTLLYM